MMMMMMTMMMMMMMTMNASSAACLFLFLLHTREPTRPVSAQASLPPALWEWNRSPVHQLSNNSRLAAWKRSGNSNNCSTSRNRITWDQQRSPPAADRRAARPTRAAKFQSIDCLEKTLVNLWGFTQRRNRPDRSPPSALPTPPYASPPLGSAGARGDRSCSSCR